MLWHLPLPGSGTTKCVHLLLFVLAGLARQSNVIMFDFFAAVRGGRFVSGTRTLTGHWHHAILLTLLYAQSTFLSMVKKTLTNKIKENEKNSVSILSNFYVFVLCHGWWNVLHNKCLSVNKLIFTFNIILGSEAYKLAMKWWPGGLVSWSVFTSWNTIVHK